ncbi:MAG: sigma-54-dependent Fis family transcriptional regulator [Candidatus Aminicenantes bacterium]|nr:MAG: sigma-54-dependent Fis family transcriptional regulator [Candidatus Aminicenantes bacterium]
MDISPSIIWGKLDGIHRIIEKTAPTDIPILIEGETGTGKGLVAKVIHALSSRCGQPFIPINCATIPDKRMEVGVFNQIAQGGTIFLDEVGDLSLDMQVKILSILEENDIRIIAATKKDLDHAKQAGRFNPELYYRLCVLKIKLPPLRERKEDIILLAEHFADGRVKKISIRAKRLLKSYNWPGNVRELQNCIDHALVLGDRKTIQPQDLPYTIRRCRKIIPAPLESLDHKEEDYIVRVLRSTRWNQHDAARILGITVQELVDKIKKYKIRGQKGDEKTLHLYKN